MMNAYVSKEELALLPADRISYAQHYAEAHQHRGWFSTLVARTQAHFRNQATLNELRKLTDRELADIGLNRATLSDAVAPRR